MFVHGVRDLQPVDECTCRDILTTVEDLSQLALEEVDVRFEAITLSHLGGEEVMIVLLDLPARGVLRNTLITSSTI